MSYRTHCDWCGKHLAYGDDQAEMPVTIYHRRGKTELNAKWAEETKAKRHFCAAPKDDDLDRGGRNRMGLLPDDNFDCCYERAIAAISGTKLSDPGMGMQWRLVPIEENVPEPEPEPSSDSEWRTNYEAAYGQGGVRQLELASNWAAIAALIRAGIVRIDDVAARSDADLLAVPGIGRKRLAEIRRAVACHRKAVTA